MKRAIRRTQRGWRRESLFLAYLSLKSSQMVIAAPIENRLWPLGLPNYVVQSYASISVSTQKGRAWWYHSLVTFIMNSIDVSITA